MMDVIMTSLAQWDALALSHDHDLHPERPVLDNVQDRVGCSHLAYLCVPSMGNLPHFAVGLLCLLCARVDGYLFPSADSY